MRDKLRCGECRGDRFRLYYKPARAGEARFGGGGDGGHDGAIIVVCLKCKKKSVVRSAPSAITVDNEGTLCGGWG